MHVISQFCTYLCISRILHTYKVAQVLNSYLVMNATQVREQVEIGQAYRFKSYDTRYGVITVYVRSIRHEVATCAVSVTRGVHSGVTKIALCQFNRLERIA